VYIFFVHTQRQTSKEWTILSGPLLRRNQKTRVKPEYTVSEIIQREMTITHAGFY